MKNANDLDSLLRFIIGIMLAIILFFIVCIVLYSLVFVTQPMENQAPNDAEYIEHNKLVARNGGTIEKRGIALEAGRKIIVYASATGISINVYGYEE